MDWCHVDYLWIIEMFLSTDGTHSLQKIHWWASDVMLNSTKSVPIKKQTHLHLTTSWMAWGWEHFRLYSWTIPFKYAYCAQYTYSIAKIARDICDSEHNIDFFTKFLLLKKNCIKAILNIAYWTAQHAYILHITLIVTAVWKYVFANIA